VAGVRSATLEPEQSELPLVRAQDGSLEVNVAKLEMHSMVVFE